MTSGHGAFTDGLTSDARAVRPRRYSPAVTAARLLLATGLGVSAVLVSAIGGWWGLAMGTVQGALALAIFLRSRSSGVQAGAVLALVPPPLAAVRHWTARLPGVCRCARLPHPPPGLVSVTGLVVALDVVLIGLALWLAAANRQSEMGKSSS